MTTLQSVARQIEEEIDKENHWKKLRIDYHGNKGAISSIDVQLRRIGARLDQMLYALRMLEQNKMFTKAGWVRRP